MKALKALLVTALAISVGLPAPQLSAATISDKEARAKFQGHLDHARQLLDDGQWKSLATEARKLLDASQSIKRRSGETEKEYNKLHHAIEQHATKLAAAARDENRAKATEHCNELAAGFQPKAIREDVFMGKEVAKENVVSRVKRVVVSPESVKDAPEAKAVAKGNVVSRVKYIVVSPGSVYNNESGAELWVQVVFVEPASADDILKLTIVHGRENAGEAQWKDQKPIQFFPIHANNNLVEVKATILVTKNGTIGIKAETSSNEQNNDSIYWMPVTLKEK